MRRFYLRRRWLSVRYMTELGGNSFRYSYNQLSPSVG
jgi:hypothetical protein